MGIFTVFVLKLMMIFLNFDTWEVEAHVNKLGFPPNTKQVQKPNFNRLFGHDMVLLQVVDLISAKVAPIFVSVQQLNFESRAHSTQMEL